MISRVIRTIIPKNQIFRTFTIAKNVNGPTLELHSWNPRKIVRSYNKLPKTPDLIYVPHIFRWIKTKFQFRYLQKTWDPDFTEGAFIYGTSKAVCKVTEIVQRDRPEELDDLLTATARGKLKQDMKTKLTKTQKAIIKLNPEDIKILVPVSVNFHNEGLGRTCKIAMRVLALKWVKPNSGQMRLVLVAIQTEFIRTYRPSETPSEWTISAFDILECVVLSTSPSYR